MKKILCSLMFFSCFAFIYLVALPDYVEAGFYCDSNECDIVCDGSAECFGTDGDDVICGSNNGETIHAGKGEDIVCGFDGDDTLEGGWGADSLFGGDDNDTLKGGHCADYFDGGDGSGDICLGGWCNDIFTTTGSCETADQGQTTDHKTQGDCP